MSRTKGSKNKIKKSKKVVEESLFVPEKKRGRPKGSKNKTNDNILNMMRKENEIVGIEAKICKDLKEKERVDDKSMMDQTDIFIDEEDWHISLDGHKTESIICQCPTLMCRDCGILKECKKQNKLERK